MVKATKLQDLSPSSLSSTVSQILLHLPRSLLLVRTWRVICLFLSRPQCLCWNLIVPQISYCTYDIMWPLDFWRFHIIAFVLCGTSVIMEREICFPIWNLRLFSCACENLLKTNFCSTFLLLTFFSWARQLVRR